MKKYPLTAMHLLNSDPERYKEFQVRQKEVESAVGFGTCLAMDTDLNHNLGKIAFNPNRQRNNNTRFWALGLSLSTNESKMITFIALHYGYNTIGRSGQNDIIIDDSFASRVHCTLLVHFDGSVELFDTASANGTFVNNQQVTQCSIKSGDEIKIGDTIISVSSPTESSLIN